MRQAQESATGPSSHSAQGGRMKLARKLDRPLPSSEHDAKSSSALLDYEGAAHYLCTTPRHVKELWAKRHVAAVKVGRRVRFTQADLDAYIATNRVNSSG
jgi:excisionase family DNA binding protein